MTVNYKDTRLMMGKTSSVGITYLRTWNYRLTHWLLVCELAVGLCTISDYLGV